MRNGASVSQLRQLSVLPRGARMLRDGSWRGSLMPGCSEAKIRMESVRRAPARRHQPQAADGHFRPESGRNMGNSCLHVYAVHMTHPDTGHRILGAARAIFEREGPASVSMRRVAEAVGITPMAIYRHFPNREALLKRISDDSFGEIVRHWNARKAGGDPVAQLIAIQMIYLDYALAHPPLFDHAFSMPREDARRFPEDFRARRSPTLNVVHDAVVEAQQAGALRAGDAWDIAMTLWAHSHGLIALYRAGRFSLDDRRFQAFYRDSLGRLLDGLAK